MAEFSDIKELYQRARKAFEEAKFWSQERVDEVVAAVAWEWLKEENVKTLAKLAVEETGMGRYEDKVKKIKSKVRGVLWDMRGAKTAGLIEEDKERGIKRYAKPIGVVANITPVTNPESTIMTIGLCLLKTRNAMIVSPHPRAGKTGQLTVEIGRKALKKVGAPEDLFLCVPNPSPERARELMRTCDFVVATGGAALVKVVYQAAKPCHTVGAGNVVSIVDETANVAEAAHKIAQSKVFNYATSCSSENAVAIHESIYDEMINALIKEGGYLCNTEERERLRKVMWPDGERLNRDIVGKPATYIAKLAGINVPENTKFIMVLGEKIGPEDRFSGEKLSVVLTVWKWKDFDEILDRVRKILRFSGIGHSVSLHTKREDRIEKAAETLEVGRVMCNVPHVFNNSGNWWGVPFTESLGCGTWAGNMTSENINWKHFLNYTIVFNPPEGKEPHIPTDEELFGEYWKKWGKD